MNKNLKKLISAVAALAISVSSVAAFGASFPDVADTATYKQAVNELVALDIIAGFEDGTFRPDENVTRAQITKMIVTALGKTAVAAADAAAGKDTQFADVTGNHWAAGYVATGTSATASNFINGYSATAFGPEDNVTYAQAIKMLVSALGYSSYAENEGGWPNGYLKYGYSLGLTEGVTGLSNDDAASRAQVAQMIDNALKCPLCMSDGYESDAWGRLVPKTVVKDGSGDLDGTKDGYQNLLNYAHDAYLVYGRISETFKSSAGSLEVGEITYDIEKSDNWLGYQEKAEDDEPVDRVTVMKGDVTDADDYLFAYSEAIIAEDENDEYTLISITPYGATESIELETDLFRAIVEGTNYNTLQIYKDNNKSKYDTYKLDPEMEVYVNGINVALTLDDLSDEENAILAGNDGGTITLVDTSNVAKSSTDGKYDYAMITKYVTAVVDYVEVDTDEATIYFEQVSGEDVDEFVVDFEDEDIDYNLTLNGEELAVADLQALDVLTIAFDVTKAFEDSSHYDVKVSRDVVEGKLRSTDTDEGEYTFDNGETYKLAWEKAAKLENGNSYTLYLDVFGKIAYTDDLASSKKYAILENVYTTNGGADYAATLITTEGKVTYIVDADDYAELKDVLMGSNGDMFDDDDKMDYRAEVQNRVIEYAVKTNGELNFKGSVKAEDEFDGQYKASTSKLAGNRVSEAITSFIDVQEYIQNGDDAVTMAYSELVDGTVYEGYSFGKTGTDKVAQLVLITAGTAGLNVNSNMAIYVSSSTEDTDDGEMDAISAYVNGELTTLIADVAFNLTAGDAFFYTKDSDGYVNRIVPVLDASVDTTYNTFYAKALEKEFDLVNAKVAAGFAGTDDEIKFNRGDLDDCALVFGAVVDYVAGEISLAVNAEGLDVNNFDIDDAAEFDVADEAKIYKYDYEYSKLKNRVETTSASAFSYTIPTAAFVDADQEEVIDFESDKLIDGGWDNDNYGKVRLALLKVVDDEVVEAIIYVPSSSKD